MLKVKLLKDGKMALYEIWRFAEYTYMYICAYLCLDED